MERKEMIDKLAAEYLELEQIRVQNDIDLNDVLKAMVARLEEMKRTRERERENGEHGTSL